MNKILSRYDGEIIKNILKVVVTIIITIVTVKHLYSDEIIIIISFITLIMGLNQIANKFVALRESDHKVFDALNKLSIDIIKIIFLVGGILYGIEVNNDSLTISLLVMIDLINLINLINLIKSVGIKAKENSIKEYIALYMKSNLEKTKGVEFFESIGIPNKTKYKEKSIEAKDLLNKNTIRKSIINNTYNFLFADNLEKYFFKKERGLLNVIKNSNSQLNKSFIEKNYNKFILGCLLLVLMFNYTEIFNLKYFENKGAEIILAGIIFIVSFLGFIVVYEITKNLKEKIRGLFFWGGVVFSIEKYLIIYLIAVVYSRVLWFH